MAKPVVISASAVKTPESILVYSWQGSWLLDLRRDLKNINNNKQLLKELGERARAHCQISRTRSLNYAGNLNNISWWNRVLTNISRLQIGSKVLLQGSHLEGEFGTNFWENLRGCFASLWIMQTTSQMKR